jgi:hypothetical protein
VIEQVNDVYECASPTYWRGRLYEAGETVLIKAGGEMTNINFRLVSKAVPAEDSDQGEIKSKGRKKAPPVDS